ncbi:MAG: hypothetical protein ACD_46C00367G0001 [uncultured bacterium]|nr:MAG: hypothetical protein ACD_46C00367G0001 [uncultured bacterium]
MLKNNVRPERLNEILQEIPLGRFAQPESVVAAIEFLINIDNNYMTGAGIDINGGQYLNG